MSKHKVLYVPADCERAVDAALRVRIEVLQGHRRLLQTRGFDVAAASIMDDIAKLTMVADNLMEAQPIG